MSDSSWPWCPGYPGILNCHTSLHSAFSTVCFSYILFTQLHVLPKVSVSISPCHSMEINPPVYLGTTPWWAQEKLGPCGWPGLSSSLQWEKRGLLNFYILLGSRNPPVLFKVTHFSWGVKTFSSFLAWAELPPETQTPPVSASRLSPSVFEYIPEYVSKSQHNEMVEELLL